MAQRTVLKTKVWHDGTSMIVLNEGDREVPDEHVALLEREGIIGREGETPPAPDVKQEGVPLAESGKGGGDAPHVNAEHTGGGWFSIEVDGVAVDKIRGKDEAEAMVAELRAEYGAEQDAPAE